jgi:signal transduction histidine kinase/DNA-binding response OmpR family regulator/putative methionine-R-sulfoxide reductase with GAF domain
VTVPGLQTVLVVDDDRAAASAIGEFLEREGYTVLAAPGGEAALKVLREVEVALVVTDLALPDMDGLAFVRAIGRLSPGPDVILVAAHATREAALAAIEAEVAGFLEKPVEPTRLGELVARVIERRGLAYENERLNAELADRLVQAEALLAVSNTIGSTLDLPEALRRICRELVRVTGAETGSAYLHDRERDVLVPTAAYHVPKELLETLAGSPIPLKQQGFHQPLWMGRRPLHTTDVAADPRFSHELFRRFEHQSGLLLPLILDDEVAGAFYLVWWKQRRTFDEPELAFLEQLSAQVSLLLRNARLFEQADRDRRRLDTLYDVARRLAGVHDTDVLLSLIVNEAARLLSVDGAGIRLLEGDNLVLSARTDSLATVMGQVRVKVGLTLSGQVVRTGEPVAVEDLAEDTVADPAYRDAALTRGLRSFLGVPLRAHGRTLGVLSLFGAGRKRYEPEEVSLVAAFADQASLAIEKGRLLRQAERGRQLLTDLYHVGLAMQTSWARDDRLQVFVRGAHEVVGFDRVSVLLAAPDGGTLELVTTYGDEQAPPSRLPLTPAAGAFYEAFQARRVVAVLSDEDLARVPPIDAALLADRFFRTRRFVVAPLVVGERAIGVVSADNKPSRRPIEAASVEPFTLLCQQLATALEETRLYEETREREEEATKLARGLTLLNQASRALYRTLDVRAVLNGALDELALAFGAGAVMVNLLSESGSLQGSVGRWLSEAHGRDVGFRPRGGITRLVRDIREPLILPDIGERPDVVHPAHAVHGVRSLAAFPVIGQGRTVLGVLFLYYTEPRAFRDVEVQLLAAYAGQLATAFENARLYEEAESQRTRLGLIFDSTSDGIVLLAPEGRIEAANGQAGELLAFDPAAAGGLRLPALVAERFTVPAEARRARALMETLLQDPDRGGEGDLQVTTPLRRVLHWVAQPTKSAGGTTIGLTLTFQDVTREREVAQMKSDFVSFVTHQLRTPLAGIKWLLELTVQERQVPEPARSYVQDAREANERLIRLVNDLLNVSRLESGKLAVVARPTDLGALTASVVEELTGLVREKGHRLSVTGAADTPRVIVDPQLFREVILNLVSNAMKYTLPGGDIAITMGPRDDGVCWAIRDSGIGIPKDAQGRLFEKFYRAENVLTVETEGTGLGLYLVRLIVEQFGGQIWCESDEGKGSMFAFIVPPAG